MHSASLGRGKSSFSSPGKPLGVEISSRSRSNVKRTIAGLAPPASRMFAIRSMDTKLVMQWMSGFISRTAVTAFHVSAGVHMAATLRVCLVAECRRQRAANAGLRLTAADRLSIDGWIACTSDSQLTSEMNCVAHKTRPSRMSVWQCAILADANVCKQVSTAHYPSGHVCTTWQRPVTTVQHGHKYKVLERYIIARNAPSGTKAKRYLSSTSKTGEQTGTYTIDAHAVACNPIALMSKLNLHTQRLKREHKCTFFPQSAARHSAKHYTEHSRTCYICDHSGAAAIASICLSNAAWLNRREQKCLDCTCLRAQILRCTHACFLIMT